MSQWPLPCLEVSLPRTLGPVLALAAACAVLLPAAPAARGAVESSACGAAPYSYAGIVGRTTARGIVATLEATAQPRVAHGHIAAWVGVGGVGLGPRGTNAWLQVGVAATESTGSALYYEVAKPRLEPSFVELGRDVSVGQRHRIGVIEMQRRPGWWRVWIDGAAVTAPIYLASSHDRWAPIATSESWNGGVPSCNAFAYRFTNIRALPASSSWHPLLDAYAIETPGYSVQRRLAANLFVRSSR